MNDEETLAFQVYKDYLFFLSIFSHFMEKRKFLKYLIDVLSLTPEKWG